MTKAGERRRGYGGTITMDIIHPDAVMLYVQTSREQISLRYTAPNISKLIIDDVVYDDPDELATMYKGAYGGWIKHPSFVSGYHTIYIFPQSLYTTSFTDVNNGGCSVYMARSGRLQPNIGGNYYRGMIHFLDQSHIKVQTVYIKNYLKKIYIPKGEKAAFMANSKLSGIPDIDKKLIEVEFNIIEDL